MKILAIDPGNIESGYAVIQMPDFELIEFGKVKNEELLEKLEEWFLGFDTDFTIDVIAIEFLSIFTLFCGCFEIAFPIEFCNDKEEIVKSKIISGLTREKIDIASNPSSLVIIILVSRDISFAIIPIDNT